MKKFVVVGTVLMLCFLVSLISAGSETTNGTPIIIVQYNGSTPISDALATGVLAQNLYTIDPKIAAPPNGHQVSLPVPADSATILKQATDNIMSVQDYPYDITNGSTVITVNTYTCNDNTQLCGYWIYATRDGKEVATNSPIWISPPPYQVVESDVIDTVTNTEILTVREDPVGAVNRVLQYYVDMQPLGRTIIGTQPP